MTSVPEPSDAERDGAEVRFPPPLVYLGALATGVLLQAFAAPLPLAIGTGARIGVGGAAAGSGVALVAAALGLFRRTGQRPEPWTPTPVILSSGVYRYTRNPMYLGMALLQAGIGIGLANAWVVALAPVSLAIVYAIAVRHEEAYLERKFGAAYLAYKASVRRWL
jgi:protein-S-isoprenylcysteine O-methyltransferase Ste14